MTYASFNMDGVSIAQDGPSTAVLTVDGESYEASGVQVGTSRMTCTLSSVMFETPEVTVVWTTNALTVTLADAWPENGTKEYPWTSAADCKAWTDFIAAANYPAAPPMTGI